MKKYLLVIIAIITTFANFNTHCMDTIDNTPETWAALFKGPQTWYRTYVEDELTDEQKRQLKRRLTFEADPSPLNAPLRERPALFKINVAVRAAIQIKPSRVNLTNWLPFLIGELEEKEKVHRWRSQADHLRDDQITGIIDGLEFLIFGQDAPGSITSQRTYQALRARDRAVNHALQSSIYQALDASEEIDDDSINVKELWSCADSLKRYLQQRQERMEARRVRGLRKLRTMR